MCGASHTLPTYQKHLHIATYGRFVVLPGAAGLPGRCRGAAGCCRVAGYPDARPHSWSGLSGCRVAGLPGTAGVLPGAAGYCRVAGLCCRGTCRAVS